MKLYETWQDAGRTLRAERDERAEQAWLRVERLVLRSGGPAVLAVFVVLVMVPMSDHLRTELIAPMVLLVFAAALTAWAIGMRRYRPDTSAAKAAGAPVIPASWNGLLQGSEPAYSIHRGHVRKCTLMLRVGWVAGAAGWKGRPGMAPGSGRAAEQLPRKQLRASEDPTTLAGGRRSAYSFGQEEGSIDEWAPGRRPCG